MSLDMLVQVQPAGELPLALLALDGLEVLGVVSVQAGRGEELLVTLSAGEPFSVEVGLLVSSQDPGLVKHPPTLRTLQQRLLNLGLQVGQSSRPRHEVALQHLEQTLHVLLCQLDVSGFIFNF